MIQYLKSCTYAKILTYIDEPQTKEMANMSHNSKALTQKFNENMKNLLFLSPVYQSIRDIDLVSTSILLICFKINN